MHPSKTQISLGTRPVLSVLGVCVKMFGALATLKAHCEDLDQSESSQVIVLVVFCFQSLGVFKESTEMPNSDPHDGL